MPVLWAGEERTVTVEEAELLVLHNEIDEHTMVTSQGLVEGWRRLGEVATALGLSEVLEVTGSEAAVDLIGELTEAEALEACGEMGIAATAGEVTLAEMQAALRAHFSEATQNPRAVFGQLDADKSGRLSHAEVRQAASILGLLLNKQQAADAFSQMDGNGDGTVTYKDFASWLSQQTLPKGRGEPEPEVELPDYIRTVGIFRDLPRNKQETVVALMATCTYKKDAVIFREGDPGDAFYLMESGRVAVTRGGVTLVTLGKGEYFGELALIEDDVRKASVHALEESTVLRLSSFDFERNCLSDEVIDRTLGQFRDWSQPAAGSAGAGAGDGGERARAMAGVVAAARDVVASGALREDDPQAALAWVKEDVVVAALRAAGGSCTLSQLDEVARACGCDGALDQAVRLLKRERKVAYDGTSWSDRSAVTVTWIAV